MEKRDTHCQKHAKTQETWRGAAKPLNLSLLMQCQPVQQSFKADGHLPHLGWEVAGDSRGDRSSNSLALLIKSDDV